MLNKSNSLNFLEFWHVQSGYPSSLSRKEASLESVSPSSQDSSEEQILGLEDLGYYGILTDSIDWSHQNCLFLTLVLIMMKLRWCQRRNNIELKERTMLNMCLKQNTSSDEKGTLRGPMSPWCVLCSNSLKRWGPSWSHFLSQIWYFSQKVNFQGSPYS